MELCRAAKLKNNMNTPEIKACRGCGNKNPTPTSESPLGHYVSCGVCGSRGPRCTEQSTAVEYWNRPPCQEAGDRQPEPSKTVRNRTRRELEELRHIRRSALLARFRRAARYFGIAMILLLFGVLLCTIPPEIRAVIVLLVIIVGCWKLAKKEAC